MQQQHAVIGMKLYVNSSFCEGAKQANTAPAGTALLIRYTTHFPVKNFTVTVYDQLNLSWFVCHSAEKLFRLIADIPPSDSGLPVLQHNLAGYHSMKSKKTNQKLTSVQNWNGESCIRINTYDGT